MDRAPRGVSLLKLVQENSNDNEHDLIRKVKLFSKRQTLLNVKCESSFFLAVTICSNNKLMEKQYQKVLKMEPWINLTSKSTGISDFKQEDMTNGLENAMTATMLYETEPQRLENLKSLEAYLLNNHQNDLPKAMQKV